MKLEESDNSLSTICRIFEERTANIIPLKNISLKVILLNDFNNEPETDNSKTIAKNPSAYRNSTRTILINASTFFKFDEKQQLGILAHEIAHAFIHTNKMNHSVLSEDIVADRLACQWGFFEELKSERIISLGRKYVECLEFYNDEPEPAFNDCMSQWYSLYLSGIK